MHLFVKINLRETTSKNRKLMARKKMTNIRNSSLGKLHKTILLRLLGLGEFEDFSAIMVRRHKAIPKILRGP